jgi:hypothetical protein
MSSRKLKGAAFRCAFFHPFCCAIR